MRKPLTWIFLLIFVVLVPFGSWYYLKQGLEYRKSLLKDLIPKDSLDLNNNFQLKGKTSLLILDEELLKDNNLIGKIEEQYGASPYFQIASFKETSLSSVVLDSSTMIYMLKNFSDFDFALIDTSGKIRNTYKSDETSVKKMIEHLAVVLPRPSEPDIKVKQ